MFVASMPPKKLVDAFQEGGFDEPVLAIIVPNSLQDVPSLRAIMRTPISLIPYSASTWRWFSPLLTCRRGIPKRLQSGMAIVPKETGVEVFQEQPNAERASEIAHEALASAASFARYYSLTPKQLPALVLHFKGVKAAYVLPLSSLSPITIDALARELRDRLDDISILAQTV